MTSRTKARPSRLALTISVGIAAVILVGPVAPEAADTIAVEDAVAPSAVPVGGVVRDAQGHPLAGASVVLGSLEARTDRAGRWSLWVVPGPHSLLVSLDGFLTVSREVRVTPETGIIDVHLARPLQLREDVVVRAVRAEERTPVTKTNIDAERIEAVNRGQEMPFLLGPTPSTNFNSDNGLAAGYSYFNIRGISQTRLNITLDGVPLQDPEDQALYFANFGDFASVVDSIQIQRGIGTSSYGSASYGGSVNFASVSPADQARLQGQIGGGSWGTLRGTIAGDTGPIGGGISLYGRFSTQTTDGFRDRSGVDQSTFYLGATRQDERSLLKLFGFVGREKTQLAYLATDEATLEGDLRFNALSPGEEDDFGQDFVQLQYTRLIGTSTTLVAQGYYNGAQGWFRIRDWASDDLQEYAIDGHFVGLILGVTHRRGAVGLNWGAHVNDFTRDHSMEIVGGSRQYLNTGLKNEASTFLKATWEVGRAQLWADAQVRHARFEYRGDQDLGSVDWTFFNPRAGVRLDPSPTVGLYAFAGRMSREPARSDMLLGEDNASVPHDLRAVAPEKVLDIEAGIEVSRGGLRLSADVYSMDFRDEIALSGELSEIGLPVRRNVPRSHRRGVELGLDWKPSAQWRILGSANLSRNRIEEWTQFYDVYDESGTWIDSTAVVHRDVAPLLTPGVLLDAAVGWTPSSALDLGLAARWVDEAQLDNTGNPAFQTPSWFNLDARLSLSLARWVRRGEPRIRVQATNLLDDDRLWPSGYSYLYFRRGAGGSDTLEGTSYYYPLATRSVYVTLDVTF
ncbi:MAG: TonB-dependent receptor [Acidobacteria bacterium]|nr:TonB-dependent receptor [Acidobacteriota bacterium]